MQADTFKEVLKELAVVLGEYTENVVIGGGIALLIYRYFLVPQSDQSTPEPAITKDFDMLIPRSLPSKSDMLDSRLLDANFRRETKSNETPPVESYIGSIADVEIEIEFLTDAKKRAKKSENVVVAGVSAQPLSYLEMSLNASFTFPATKNIDLRVVAPSSWMFHKALTFPRRRSQDKLSKDLYGIWYAGQQLGEVSQTALRELSVLTKKHPAKWRQRAKRQLRDWIENAANANWELLEAQDPARILTRERFRMFVEERLTL